MKKVLSVLLAAAMVMGMSVASFAANTKAEITFSNTIATGDTTGNVAFTRFVSFNVVRDGAYVAAYTADTSKDAKLEAGDVLYFPVFDKNTNLVVGYSNLDKDWKIKINNAEYVDSASFYAVDTDAKAAAVGLSKGDLAVKVVLEDDFDHFAEDTVKFYFYLYDAQNDNASGKVEVALNFADYTYTKVNADDLDWVITVDGIDGFEYIKGEKAKKATIDFDGQAYTEFKMYSEEKYVLSATAKYNKALSKEYDTDVDVLTFRMNGVENFDILFPAAKDNKQIVAVVDGELVPVEATYVEDHKFASGKVTDGYLVEDAEYLSYAVIDADVEIEVEAEEPVEAPVEAEKANPETGAADFVGAAVAMAVVSVAAAGALALKK